MVVNKLRNAIAHHIKRAEWELKSIPHGPWPKRELTARCVGREGGGAGGGGAGVYVLLSGAGHETPTHVPRFL